MFSITLPITVPAYSRSKYERAFRALSKIHNAVVSYAIGRMNVLNQNKEYLELKKQCTDYMILSEMDELFFAIENAVWVNV